MTIQERNEYLTEQSWFQQERQHLFDMSGFKKGTKYKNYGEILQMAGISKEARKNKYAYYKEKLDYFLCTQKQKDGQIKITKVKGELVENPFSWELRKPFMSTGYMLEMMIIHILDNHINENWDKNKWCEVLGLLVANRKDYDLSEFKYSPSYFEVAYDCMKQIAHTRLHDTLVNMEKRGTIKRRTRIVCRRTVDEPLREFTKRERYLYEQALRKTFNTARSIEIETAKIYPEVYPKFREILTSYPEFQGLYYRFVIEPEYLYPDEHSYLKEFDFYMYQKRLQHNLKPKVLKLAQSRKDKLINDMAMKFKFHQFLPQSTELEINEELVHVYTLSTMDYWKKKFSRYGTDVRKVVDFLYKGGQNHWTMMAGCKPRIGS